MDADAVVGPAHAMDPMVSGASSSAMRRSDSASFSVCVNRRPCWRGSRLRPGYRRERLAPVAMAMIKSQVWRDSEQTMEQARVRAQHPLTLPRHSLDFQEGVRALVEKRPPSFAPYRPLLNL